LTEDVGILYGYLVYLQPIVNFYGHLINFVVIWYNFSRFGMVHQEKSGNPGAKDFAQLSDGRSISVVIPIRTL
jgi:hypothetical protein